MKELIPDEALQQHIAVLGKTGSGKTFAVKGLVERLLEAGRRVGIVDPTGAWWGLRSSRDGKHAGFPILVLGGDHGDLPLPALGGAAVARLLAEQGVNLVADTSQLTVGERTRWFIDFASTLYRINRTPLHLVLDEAHNFAPQGSGAMRDIDVGKMLHAANTLASGGRSRGIRLALITQRPQKLHKDTLTSADTLIAMRVLAPHDRGAVEDWIKGCGDVAQGKEVLNSLASLRRGEGWVWYPEGGYLKRWMFPPITTFDSSATPTDGELVATPKSAAAIDLTEISAALADAVAEAEANDPKKLRARIEELQAELAEVHEPATPAGPEGWELELARKDGFAQALRAIAPITDRLETLAGSIAETIAGFREDLQRLAVSAPDVQRLRIESTPGVELPSRPPLVRTPHISVRTPHVPRPAAGQAVGLGNSGKRRMLIALAQNPGGLTPTKLSIITGIARSGGTWRTYLGDLRGLGWVTTKDHDLLAITDSGLKNLGAYERLPTGKALIEYWRGRLGDSGKRKIFDALVNAYPSSMIPALVANKTGIAIAGGTWRTYLGELRGLELVVGRGELQANPDLFR